MELFADRYELLGRLGQGGTAVVWEAIDHRLGARRAVKMLSPGSGIRRARDRLKAEAKAMAQLQHKHVLRVYDIGYADGKDYVVMEKASGSLHERLLAEGPMAMEEAARLSLQVLSALEAAHAHGIVHRDVKPQNVLLDQDGDALLADFGIALIDQDRLRSTRTGVAMGSLGFMAPEQRLDARSVDPRADVYAMGCTLYHLVTGETPIDLFTVEAGHPRMAAVPKDLVPVIQRATRHDPTQRYPSASRMADALALAAGITRSITAERPSKPVLDMGRSLDTMLPGDFSDEAFPESTYTPTRESVTEPLVAPTLVAHEDDVPPAPPPQRPPWQAAVALVMLVGVAVGVYQAVSRDPGEPSQPVVTSPEEAAEEPESAPTPEQADVVEEPPEDASTETPSPPEPTPTVEVKSPEIAAPTPAPKLPTNVRSWDVSYGGKRAKLVLNGPDDALYGTMTVFSKGSSLATPLTGTLNGETLTLAEDPDINDAGQYDLRLKDGRIEGTFSRYDGMRTFAVTSMGQ